MSRCDCWSCVAHRGEVRRLREAIEAHRGALSKDYLSVNAVFDANKALWAALDPQEGGGE